MLEKYKAWYQEHFWPILCLALSLVLLYNMVMFRVELQNTIDAFKYAECYNYLHAYTSGGERTEPPQVNFSQMLNST